MDNVKRLLILLDLINLKHRHFIFFFDILFFDIFFNILFKLQYLVSYIASMTSYVLFNEQILCTYLHYTLFTQMVNQASGTTILSRQ